MRSTFCPCLRPTALAVFTLLVSAAQAQTAAPKPDDNKLETVLVTGIRAAKDKSLAAKRYADGVTEVISAEDIGKMPDKNVADALRLLGGSGAGLRGGQGAGQAKDGDGDGGQGGLHGLLRGPTVE